MKNYLFWLLILLFIVSFSLLKVSAKSNSGGYALQLKSPISSILSSDWIDEFTDENPRWEWSYSRGTGYNELITIENVSAVKIGITNESVSSSYSDCALREVIHEHESGVFESRLRYEGDGRMGTMGWGVWFHNLGDFSDVDVAWFFIGHPESSMPFFQTQVILNDSITITPLLDVNLSEWHTYRIEFSPNGTYFYIDDALVSGTPKNTSRPLRIEAWIDNTFLPNGSSEIIESNYTDIENEQILYIDYISYSASIPQTTTSTTTTSPSTTSTSSSTTTTNPSSTTSIQQDIGQLNQEILHQGWNMISLSLIP
ncbi:MAG: hypothetical protein ABH950_06340 [Candidatus Altiarchaeota archaeon]